VTLWFCEDDDAKWRNLSHVAQGAELRWIPCVEALLATLHDVATGDAVSIDSQLPSVAGADPEPEAGLYIAALLIDANKAVHLNWHSGSAKPELLEHAQASCIRKSREIIAWAMGLANPPSIRAAARDLAKRIVTSRELDLPMSVVWVLAAGYSLAGRPKDLNDWFSPISKAFPIPTGPSLDKVRAWEPTLEKSQAESIVNLVRAVKGNWTGADPDHAIAAVAAALARRFLRPC